MKLKFNSIFCFLFLLSLSLSVRAQSELGNVSVNESSMTRNGNIMSVNIGMDFSSIKVKSDQATIFTPMIVNGNDTLRLNGVGVYGRTRWFQYERAGKNPLSGEGELALRYSKKLGIVDLSQNVPYQDWMDGSSLIIDRQDYGCAGCSEGELMTAVLGGYAEEKEEIFQPVFIYEDAIAEEVKTRELSGRAFVDFPVNQTVIYPDYRRNSVELAKIIATIDSVKNDKDITVTSISIKGFASPEGSYENNVRLAKGRTEALMKYVQTLYKFPEGFIKTSYEPEDWEGLREWVENSNIDHKDGILAIIDSDLAPDPKNTKIQITYPTEYKFLLANVYPALRHSDYKIEYEIRSFTDLSEIAELITTSPQKLSLSEMYRYAASLEPGSTAYNEVFETAVRMYPNDEGANLNAANSAMARGDYQSAQKYLSKAGNGEKARYARELLDKLISLQK